MTLQETGKLCVFIRKTTHAWSKENENDFLETVKAWHECLKDVPYEMAMKSTREYIACNNFQPTIADVRKGFREWQEQQKELRAAYNDIYFSAIAHYPCYKDDAETRELFDQASKKSVSKARVLGNKLIDYVKENELTGNIDNIPTLKEWLKGEIESG